MGNFWFPSRISTLDHHYYQKISSTDTKICMLTKRRKTIPMGIKSSSPSSKTMLRVLHISTTLALDYDILKICLKDDVTIEWVVSLPSSFIVLFTILITWLRHLTTISKRWNLMTTLRITNFPLSKSQILLHGTKHFFSAN